jgi:hypothetical protein
VSVVDEAVDGALGSAWISEGDEPLVRATVGCDGHGTGAVALGEDLVGTAGFLGVHLVEAEVVEDKQVDGEEFAQLGFVGVEEPGLPQGLEDPVGRQCQTECPLRQARRSMAWARKVFPTPTVPTIRTW